VLLIVTSDHETGGLSVLNNNGAGTMPDVSWSTTGHTGVDVPFYVEGFNIPVSFQINQNKFKNLKSAGPFSLYYK
jgi:alkaline phosphatase